MVCFARRETIAPDDCFARVRRGTRDWLVLKATKRVKQKTPGTLVRFDAFVRLLVRDREKLGRMARPRMRLTGNGSPLDAN